MQENLVPDCIILSEVISETLEGKIVCLMSEKIQKKKKKQRPSRKKKFVGL